MQGDLSIVIVSYNTCSLLVDCLGSLQGTNVTTQVIVVDNASRDNSAETVREQFPQVLLLQNARNMGYASANNRGIRAATGRYLLLLNPDTRVQEGALDLMVSFMDSHDKVGAVGLRLLNADGSLQPSGKSFPTLASALGELLPIPIAWREQLRGPAIRRDYGKICEVDEVSGAALGLRQSALDQVGLLDEDFFFLGEDIDLCWRLKKAGWQVSYLPTSSVIHYGGRSHKEASSYAISLFSQRGYDLLFRKHRSLRERLALKEILIWLTILKLFKWLAWYGLRFNWNQIYPATRAHLAELVWLARN